MAWRGRGRGRPGGFARHDMTLREDEDASDVPVTFPVVKNMPAKAPTEDALDPETLRLLVRSCSTVGTPTCHFMVHFVHVLVLDICARIFTYHHCYKCTDHLRMDISSACQI
jgi:hypothetical protein